MKKLVKFFATLSLVTLVTTVPVLAAPQYPLNLVIDNHKVNVSDTSEPFMMNRITYFPTDFLISEFGVSVKNNDNGFTLTTYDDNNNKIEYVFTTGSLDYTINGIKYTAAAAPTVVSSRHCIPTRTIAPLLDLNFSYNNDSNTLTLTSNCFDKRFYQK